ncbi:hypothetical protein KM043_017065 [Ampulex compressa]|nr:hypothetical protein KM043_017065 [Ampulex compressa]
MRGQILKYIKMHTWYWFGKDLDNFLFWGYNVTTIWGLFCTCLGLAAFAILYEGMKISQIKLQQMSRLCLQKSVSRSSENCSLLYRMSQRPLGSTPFASCWYQWPLQMLHWFIHTTLGYVFMMAIMTYNVYISIALVLGAGIGYWIFGTKLIHMKITTFYKKQQYIECDRNCSDVIINQQRRESTIIKFFNLQHSYSIML